MTQQTQRDLFAARNRKKCSANVDPVVGGGPCEAAVLRQPALGEIDAREQTNPREQRRHECGGRRIEIAKMAVDTHAHAKPVTIRLEVKVGSSRVDCRAEERREPPHRRRSAVVSSSPGRTFCPFRRSHERKLGNQPASSQRRGCDVCRFRGRALFCEALRHDWLRHCLTATLAV